MRGLAHRDVALDVSITTVPFVDENPDRQREAAQCHRIERLTDELDE